MARGLSSWLIGRVGAWDGPELHTALTYRRDLPWEVSMRLLTAQNHGAGSTWLLGRDLLTHGLGARSGIGDVRVSPAGPALLLLELNNGNESMALYLRYVAVRGFLQATARLVPYGTEHRHFCLDSIDDALRRAA